MADMLTLIVGGKGSCGEQTALIKLQLGLIHKCLLDCITLSFDDIQYLNFWTNPEFVCFFNGEYAWQVLISNCISGCNVVAN